MSTKLTTEDIKHILYSAFHILRSRSPLTRVEYVFGIFFLKRVSDIFDHEIEKNNFSNKDDEKKYSADPKK